LSINRVFRIRKDKKGEGRRGVGEGEDVGRRREKRERGKN
jgi:hypothetical protein